ncbi:MAG: HlyD family secretion protein [Myxococcales bacterium]|nr:HlyD family secretion protein [Myxococcales bacterium]
MSRLVNIDDRAWTSAGLHRWLSGRHDLPAARLVQSPAPLRWVAVSLATLLPTLILLAALLPWQQAGLGTGKVIAYAPEERTQVVEATINGRIAEWLVKEGAQVEQGTPLVQLADNDAIRLDRLQRTAEAGSRQLDTLDDQLLTYQIALEAAEAERNQQVAEIQAKIAGLQRKRTGVEAEVEVERLQSDRLATLADDGISSRREADVARLKVAKAEADLLALDREIAATRASRDKAGAAGDAKVASARASLQSARAKLAEQEQKQLSMEGAVDRQQAQLVRAPRAGTVLRLYGGPGGAQVKAGDPLLTLVPDATARAVELWVLGNDMPLVTEGSEVRLLFEGWPALQFVGFPGADAGTYAGQVAFVDATDDGSGRFRVVVVPADDAPPWPDAQRLRQGVRAKGWFLFGQVSWGYEMWRRLNGFPPNPTNVQSGSKSVLPSFKKPRAPVELK